MRLSVSQMKQLQQAILMGFSPADLRELVLFELGQDLTNVSGGGPFPQIVLDVIDWANKQGSVETLANAVRAARPENLEVQRRIPAVLSSATGVSTSTLPKAAGGSGQFASSTEFILILNRLTSDNLNSIRTLLPDCWVHVSSNGPVIERVNALVEWAASPGGATLRGVYRAAHQALPKVFGPDDSFLE